MPQRRSLGIRCKLVIIFVLIKVLPLVALAWVAWSGITLLGTSVQEKIAGLSQETQAVVGEVSELAVDSSIRALDIKSRENIERLTTDTARIVARFLYSRDDDIRLAASLAPTRESYRKFLAPMRRKVTGHKPWVMNDEGTAWVPADNPFYPEPMVKAQNHDNAKDFHYRPPEGNGIQEDRPLYLEMTFVDLKGNERIKITTSDLLPSELRNVADPANTYCKAERYFESLKQLKPGEVFVSEVIGPYLKSPLIGAYTKERAEKKGIPFKPEESAYAGKENPVGKRFRGLVRWASPVVQGGKVVGWVTLALDHTHIMEFTDHIVPTDERYSPISDAGSGNYAFMWDYKDRNISHPRDYFIVGYDPETGEPATPWLEQGMYEDLKAQSMSVADWEKTAPVMLQQSLKKKPAKELTDAGLLGLDCRYLNFAPQCEGWYNLTKGGGSGSFVIFWSGLWKLTTAAAIPYHTGIYGQTPRGFGFVTIGANVHEFHKAATDTGKKITDMATDFERRLAAQNVETQRYLKESLRETTREITYSTMVMVFIVIMIAVWMASKLTKMITNMITGIRLFQSGDMDHRLAIETKDEVGQLAETFNDMSDSIQALVEDLKAAEEKYRGFFENATEGIFRTTLDGKLINVNPAFARLFGYESSEEMLEKVDHIGEDLYANPNRRMELIEQLEKFGAVRDFEYEVKSQDGSTRFLRASCYLVNDADGEQYVEGISTDITERRLKEQAEVERESALAASKAKSVFLANMSHEIRTPMNALLGMADMLADTELDEDQREYVELFHKAGESLLKLLNEILDFSKVEAGQMVIETMPLDLAKLVSEVESIMSIQAASSSLVLRCRVSDEVSHNLLGDNLRVKQVLMNLVGNAVKFTDSGTVTIDVQKVSSTETTETVRFEVRDTGMGIEENKIREVFKSFTQADSSTTKKHGGSGLGLTIAKELVELMGGTITADSAPGIGTTFRFDLVLEKRLVGSEPEESPVAAPVASDEKAEASAPGHGKRIMVVEDSESNLMLIEHYLKATDHTLTTCENGQVAVNAYKDDPSFDVILMDILMPVLDGIQATRKIREFEEAAGLTPVPIIALTANAFAEDKQNCLDAGCSYYLAKPVRKADLIDLINTVSRP